MLKQSFSIMKKILAILLAVLFIVSLTVGAVSACNSHGHHNHIGHSYSNCGSSNCHTYGSAHCHTYGSSHGHCCKGKIPCHNGSCDNDTSYDDELLTNYQSNHVLTAEIHENTNLGREKYCVFSCVNTLVYITWRTPEGYLFAMYTITI